jgi:hypothetical protein
MSLALYVVAAIDRDSVRSTEAGLKYFVLGALSSGMLLYGASLIYGFTGTVSFAGIAKAANHASLGLVFGLVFLFAGFCFKISAVPFHVDARCQQGVRPLPPSSPPRPRSPVSPSSCAPPWPSRHPDAMAADRSAVAIVSMALVRSPPR